MVYNAALLILYPLLRFLSLFQKRLKENFILRKEPLDFTKAHGKKHFWFHAASAGEFEQARAVAVELKKLYKDAFLSFSYFSDSALRAKKNDSVPDILFALPFDFSWTMRRLVRSMQPTALFIAKYDAWPNQVRAAKDAKIPIYLISATLPKKSLRYRWPWRFFLAQTYRAMQRIFAVNADHAARLELISPENVLVSGDTRFDAIALRLKEKNREEQLIKRIQRNAQKKVILVAGSTYTASEKMLIDFLRTAQESAQRKFFMIIAPHHIEAARLAGLETLCSASGVSAKRASAYQGESVDVLIVDSLGVLPHLYPLARAAFVGGGFEGSIHSVIEPAVAGVPILTGPAIQNSPEACELASQGLVGVIPVSDAAAFEKVLAETLARRTKLSSALRTYFNQRLGVSRQIVHTVVDDLFPKKKVIHSRHI